MIVKAKYKCYPASQVQQLYLIFRPLVLCSATLSPISRILGLVHFFAASMLKASIAETGGILSLYWIIMPLFVCVVPVYSGK